MMGCMDDYYLQEIGRYSHLPCDGLRTNHRQTHRLARVVRHGHPLPSSIHRNSWPGNRLQFNHVNKNKIHPFSMSSSYVNQGATVGLESDSINIKKMGGSFWSTYELPLRYPPHLVLTPCCLLCCLPCCLKHVAGLYGDALRDRRRGSKLRAEDYDDEE